MKQILIALPLIMIILFSCKVKSSHERESRPESNIVGEWKFVKTEVKRRGELEVQKAYRKNIIEGYTFFENEYCENKIGYFKEVKGNGYGEEFLDLYLGNKTIYRLIKDSLEIFNLESNKWESHGVFSIIGDTLTVQLNDSIYNKFARIKYIIDQSENYDEIIISYSGCFGFCPRLTIDIEKNGNVLYFGGAFTTRNGIYSSRITKEQYCEIEKSFKKSDIPNLRSKYSANWTDDITVNITFVNGGKIIKSIEDYGWKSPPELIWAYSRVKFLYQQLELIPLKNTNYFSPSQCLIEFKDELWQLSSAESFFLATLLYNGREVSRRLQNKKYKIEYTTYTFKGGVEKKDIEYVYTDGRYYQFKDKTIDVGFYFKIEESYESLMEDAEKWYKIEKMEDSIASFKFNK